MSLFLSNIWLLLRDNIHVWKLEETENIKSSLTFQFSEKNFIHILNALITHSALHVTFLIYDTLCNICFFKTIASWSFATCSFILAFLLQTLYPECDYNM